MNYISNLISYDYTGSFSRITDQSITVLSNNKIVCSIYYFLKISSNGFLKFFEPKKEDISFYDRSNQYKTDNFLQEREKDDFFIPLDFV